SNRWSVEEGSCTSLLAKPKALRELQEDKDIVIKPADKGGGLVILSSAMYIEEAHRQLNDPDVYEKLPSDPIKTIQNLFLTFLNKGVSQSILTKQEYNFLNKKFPKIPVIYFLPKIHKNDTNPPGRPIVSGINSLLCNLSQYIDTLLQPAVKKMKSYLQDS
ncbi:Hypothetical predicted protein, partial [Pelobates cultripes]